MKNMKWIIPLAVVVVLLMVALPAAADDPFGGPPSKTSGNGTTTWGAIYVGGTYDNLRGSNFYHDPSTGCFPTSAQGTANSTTTGQVPGGATPLTYFPEPQALGTTQRPQPGIATQLNQPGQPKTMNNDSTAVTASGVALIPGIANQNGEEFQVGGKIGTQCGVNDKLTGVVDSVEYDRYKTNWSASTTVPGLSTRWFKFDTVKSRDVEVYVDDVPKWGAAYRYFDNKGCLFHQGSSAPGTGNCDQSDNLQRIGIDTSEIGKYFLSVDDRMDFSVGDSQFLNGLSARVFPPEAISNMDYFWPTPNNALLTTRAGSRPRVADTQGSYGGYNRGTASVITTGAQPSPTAIWLEPADQIKWGDGNTHLLAGKFHWDGWVYVRVFNNMYWDQNVVVGTRFTPNQKYDFPCDNCPYPFDPQK